MTDKGKTREVTTPNCWSRNFSEGVSEMVRNSPSLPGPIYVTEGDHSKGKRKLVDIKYSSANTNDEEVCSKVKSLIISQTDSPELSEEEIKQRFCKVWMETKDCISSLSGYIIDSSVFDKNNFIDRFYPDTYFIQPRHKSYAIQAQLYEVLLRNFESESFGTSDFAPAHESHGEVTREPKVRAARFYQYFKSESEATDIDYIHWFRGRVTSFLHVFWTKMPSTGSFAITVDAESLLQTLGGPSLVSYFTAAARACWKLQTLAFASEHPAARLNIKEGDPYEETCMVPVVDVVEDQFDGDRGDLTVSFMVAPGFYFKLGEALIRAEVYLIAVAPEL